MTQKRSGIMRRETAVVVLCGGALNLRNHEISLNRDIATLWEGEEGEGVSFWVGGEDAGLRGSDRRG